VLLHRHCTSTNPVKQHPLAFFPSLNGGDVALEVSSDLIPS